MFLQERLSLLTASKSQDAGRAAVEMDRDRPLFLIHQRLRVHVQIHITPPDKEGRFVVIGNSQWAANSFIDFNGNGDLALNAMNWLSSDEDLISIRPKPPENSQITMTSNQLRWVRISSQFLLPLVVVLAGVSVWWRRR